MTKMDILTLKLIVPDDYQQQEVRKMVLFGLKTHFEKIFLGYFYLPTLPMQKNGVKMVPKQVFTWGGFKRPPPYLMLIPEAPSCRVKEIFDLKKK